MNLSAADDVSADSTERTPPVRIAIGDGYEVDSDPARLDLDVVHGFLTHSYWARGIPRRIVARAIAGSLCFGLYRDAEQVGFARVVTDRATFAWLADVFVLEDHRGRGLGNRLVSAVLAHPDLQSLRRWLLATRDAQPLYRGLGFRTLALPGRYMEMHDPDVYQRG